eukprot:6212183-Pleurochrysis_carterae.AAC.2
MIGIYESHETVQKRIKLDIVRNKCQGEISEFSVLRAEMPVIAASRRAISGDSYLEPTKVRVGR